MPENKDINRLEAILNAFMDSGVKPEELIQAIESTLEIIKKSEEYLQSQIDKNTSGNEQKIAQLKAEIADTHKQALALIEKAKNDSSLSVSEIKQLIATEVARLEASMPEIPEPEVFDPTDLQSAIDEHTELLASISELITGENVRNALEVLPEGEKLEIEAIQDLRKELDEIRHIRNHTGATAIIAHRLDQIGDVTIDFSTLTNAQVLAYNSATQQWTNQTPSGGGGSVTVATPTGTVNGVNMIFTVVSTPKWIVADGITYFPTLGYSIAGTTVTMDNPPGLYIRYIY